MKCVKALEVVNRLNTFGRIYKDDKRDRLCFNWTCSGFELVFEGKLLIANLSVEPEEKVEQVPDIFGEFEQINTLDWPWIVIFIDDIKDTYRKISLSQVNESIVLFKSDVKEVHKIKVIKLTENYKTQLALSSFLVDGEIKENPIVNYSGHIEFLGDSITCGYGNDTLDVQRAYYTSDENGLNTFGAIVADNLNLKPSFIGISGMTLTRYPIQMLPFSLDEVYDFTDKVYEEKMGKTAGFEVWDFNQNPTDYIVINIGTNDSSMTAFGVDPTDLTKIFEEKYKEFLGKIRKLNGSASKIICTCGSIDYYLYDTICSAVEKYQKESNDDNVYHFKFSKMLPAGRDVGASFHPSKYKHRSMAEELTKFLKRI